MPSAMWLDFFGARFGALTVALYILFSAVNLPMFAGFKGGGALLSVTGDYITGFVFTLRLCVEEYCDNGRV